jgi:uncharacterized protein YdcH (DUF465 family)
VKEEEIVEVLKKDNAEFRKLTEEHKNLEELLAKIDNKRFLTPEEEVERKKIQKQKLLKKDRMAAMIRNYKKGSMN